MKHISQNAFILPSRPGFHSFSAKSVFDDIDPLSGSLSQVQTKLERDLAFERQNETQATDDNEFGSSTLVTICMAVTISAIIQCALSHLFA
ncbi:hypothetical protein SAMN05421759_1033 [Roseivivax lentus]|uniref:Uncharacterized protein n=1 Tax=Roseivivax lentus TaxID=633194 RepID=A0A1N7LNH8_9RHOB|nr:hypothetical protein [Roseivivax lentus]SIS75388.1 hypothetical protein SAMN05421759_1033 [Roseivivax lentus]